MATEEARNLLNALMGAERNAPLPPGAAVPSKRKAANQTTDGALLLPGKRSKSCYDRDIDPLYTAWGVDVYELFVNTKSDLGANPYIVDAGAHQEFVNLPQAEQTKLGFHYFLFQKLQELVRQCDRTVNRNKEKLKQEVSRKLSQRGGQDFVEDVDDQAVEALARDMVQAENITKVYNERLQDLDNIVQQENIKKETVAIFSIAECYFESATKNFVSKIDSQKIVSLIMADAPLLAYYSILRNDSELEVTKEISLNLLTDMLTLYIRVRAHSYAKKKQQEHKVSKDTTKARSLRTEIKKTSDTLESGH